MGLEKQSESHAMKDISLFEMSEHIPNINILSKYLLTLHILKIRHVISVIKMMFVILTAKFQQKLGYWPGQQLRILSTNIFLMDGHRRNALIEISDSFNDAMRPAR